MMKHSDTRGKKGFTLVELLVYMGILSLLFIIFIDMFATLVNRQLETESDSSIQQDSSYFFSKMSYDFGQAHAIVEPVAPGTPSASLKLLLGTEHRDYFLSDGNLVSSKSGILTQINSSETNVSDLTFQRLGNGDGNDVIQMKCTITSDVKKESGYDINHFSTTLGIREK